ncbi:hypothetical protein I4U23_011716 [Adineta vaga]|nr:hypothetical protein I4U23_011716 [Adineta vaga]
MEELASQTTENLIDENLDDDDDNDQSNTPTKIVPILHQLSSSGFDQNISLTKFSSRLELKPSTDDDSFNAENLIKTDLNKYVQTLIPKDHSQFIQCHLHRKKDGLTKIFSLYFIGENQNDQILLLNARKHSTIAGHVEFYIGVNIENPSKNLNEANCIAKLRSKKILGHEYILLNNQDTSTNQSQALAVIYDEHIRASKDPRKMTVLLHDTGASIRQFKDNETIIDEWRAGRSNNFLEFKNKSPTFNEESKIYTINFLNNRIKQPSHKNFQLISTNEHDEESVIMQFGRIDENTFALDYRYPFTAIDAFAIALSSFHNRFRT